MVLENILMAKTFERLCLMIRSITPDLTSDIYALSFWKYNVDDDPRRPQVAVGYNTVSQWRKESNESNEDEAKWNFAFWLQNEEILIGDDAHGYTEWIKSLPSYYTDEEAKEDYDTSRELGRMIQGEFMMGIIKIVQRLHQEGVIAGKFDKTVPVIIHELEYYDVPLKWTIEANPKNSAREFENWVMGNIRKYPA
jgi:hypothetical protein